MHDFGTTEQQLALVAEKNHAHSVHNPKAMYRHEIPTEEILASRQVVDPLRLLMLCTPNEGAAAAILSAGPARSGQVRVIGQGLRTARRAQAIGEHMPTDSPVAPDEPVTARAAGEAYGQAGVGPEDLDLVELQDTDSGGEIINSELLGLCARGEGGPLVQSGATRLGAKLPVNASGGLLSKGEPVGASALGSGLRDHQPAPRPLRRAAGRGGADRPHPRARRRGQLLGARTTAGVAGPWRRPGPLEALRRPGSGDVPFVWLADPERLEDQPLPAREQIGARGVPSGLCIIRGTVGGQRRLAGEGLDHRQVVRILNVAMEREAGQRAGLVGVGVLDDVRG